MLRAKPFFALLSLTASCSFFAPPDSETVGVRPANGGASGAPGGSGGVVGAPVSDGGQAGATSAGSNDGGASDAAGAAGEAGAGGTAEPPTKTQLQRLPVDGFYPRLIQRSNGTLVASIVALQKSGNYGATIFESTDDGLSFQVIGNIDEPLAKSGLCCGTLFELPKALGSLPATTLLWSASVGSSDKTTAMSLPIWSSSDGGKTWSPLSTIPGIFTDANHRTVWEPEFSMLDDGTLVCHFSDGTDAAHSEKLSEVQTSDGKVWSARQDTVALATQTYSAGMPVVRRSPSGTFFMSYQVCGVTGMGCAVHVRSSSDGWNWGTATNIGTLPTTVDGKYFVHAATILWSNTPSDLGRLFLIGQLAFDATGSLAPENGDFIMANAQNGVQFWYSIEAPAPVNPAPYDNYCPNYSSSMVALDGGKVGLELASRYDGSACRTYFARGPLLGTGDASGVTSGSVYRLVNVTSGLCLDVVGGSKLSQALVDQATCDGSAQQQWAVSSDANGGFTIKSQNSGRCLTPAGGENNGALLEQAGCDGTQNQSWSLHGVGTGYFEVLANATTCLDNPAASTKSGTNMQLWSCDHESPQIWHFEPQ